MIYRFRIPTVECNRLASLVGKSLDSVTTDGWAAYLTSSDLQLAIEPKEGPDQKLDPAYTVFPVERPAIRVRTAEHATDAENILVQDVGNIKSISIISILISWSEPVIGESIHVLPNVSIPEGLDYRWVLHQPKFKKEAERTLPDGNALIDFDIAVELVAENDNAVAFYTRGFFIKTSVSGLPDDEPWSKKDLHATREISGSTPDPTSA